MQFSYDKKEYVNQKVADSFLVSNMQVQSQVSITIQQTTTVSVPHPDPYLAPQPPREEPRPVVNDPPPALQDTDRLQSSFKSDLSSPTQVMKNIVGALC